MLSYIQLISWFLFLLFPIAEVCLPFIEGTDHLHFVDMMDVTDVSFSHKTSSCFAYSTTSPLLMESVKFHLETKKSDLFQEML